MELWDAILKKHQISWDMLYPVIHEINIPSLIKPSYYLYPWYPLIPWFLINHHEISMKIHEIHIPSLIKSLIIPVFQRRKSPSRAALCWRAHISASPEAAPRPAASKGRFLGRRTMGKSHGEKPWSIVPGLVNVYITMATMGNHPAI